MSRRRVFAAGLMGITAGLSAWWGCSSAHQAALELDKVAASLDRYGFAGISAPFLTVPAEEGKFKLDRPASFYFERALTTVQGGVRTYDARAVDAQVAIRINIEQALATIAQFDRARSIAEVREAKRKAGIHKKMLEAAIAAATPPPELTAVASGVAATALGQPRGTPGAAIISAGADLATPANNPLVKSTLGMLDAIATAPDPDAEALPSFIPTTQPVPDKPPFSEADRLALATVGRTFSAGIPLSNEPFQISAREALLIANGDFVTQTLLEWFQYPEGNRMGDYELFFCPVVVSVKPGYETRKGYLADITVSVDLARKRTNPSCDGQGTDELEFLSERFPDAAPPIQVTGVFPLIDAQVLDEASSRRRLYAMAFQLATVGFGTTANVFLDYARKLEQDAKTRTSLTVASAYTLGANSFGFRVEPQFVALKSPASLDATPGDVLQSRTFPAMAMLLVHRSYLYHRRDDVKKDAGSGSWTNQVNYGGSPESVTTAHRRNFPPSGEREQFQYLVLRTSVRWTPVKSHWPHWRGQSEVQLWKRALALDKAAHWVDASSGKSGLIESKGSGFFDPLYPGCVPNHYQRAHLASRILTLRQMALDTQALIRFDHRRPDKDVTVESVEPKNGWVDQPTALTFRGTGFEGNVQSVTVGGRKCSFLVLGNECLVATVPAWQDRNASGGDGSPWPRTDPRGQADIAAQKPAPHLTGEVVIGARCSVTQLGGADGLITFDRLTPAADEPEQTPGGKKTGAVAIQHGAGNRITHITTAGNFADSIELLKLIADAIANEGGACIDFHIEAGTSGEVKAGAKGNQPAGSKANN